MKALLVLTVLLAGCGTMQQPNMTIGQLREVAGDKNAGVICGTIVSPGYSGYLLTVGADREKKDTGNVTATLDGQKCTITMNGGAVK